MEQVFLLEMETHKNVDFDKVRNWINHSLAGKVDVQFFLAAHAGAFSGLDSIEGTLFVSNTVAISEQELTRHLCVPNALTKSLRITRTSKA